MDFHQAAPQNEFNLIPKGTIAKVHMMIKSGGYDDPERNWRGGYATHNEKTGTVYLDCEFTVLDGYYAKRKVWSRIGLHSPKSPDWENMGKTFIRAILNSARGFSEKDDSPEAIAARQADFSDLDGIEFIARIDVETNQNTGEERNVIKVAITKGHKDYPAEVGDVPFDTRVSLPPSNLPSWAR